ncbi:MAG: DUF6298 domain-containing protein [Cyclobacteriaceae bacterium]
MNKLYLTLLLLLLLAQPPAWGQFVGDSMHNHSQNPNYFSDPSGNPILLTGSHTWANFQEFGTEDQNKFDWSGYLDMMEEHGHNFMRLWVWEQSWKVSWTQEDVYIEPLPYQRTSQGKALDGKGKFDLAKFNQAYFDRLRSRIQEASERGIYVSIMLFQGWSMNMMDSENADPYDGHPFNGKNNINNIHFENTKQDADEVPTLHSMMLPEILKLQEAYVNKVIETVNDLDNVLYEIINEGGSIDWQYHMINFVKATEKNLPRQHLVGMTTRYHPYLLNKHLNESPADWISYTDEPEGRIFPKTSPLSNYGEDPPENTSGKVSILDTDHIWGIGGTYNWAWKAFCRGHNPVFMDPWQPLAGKLLRDNLFGVLVDGGISKNTRAYPDWELFRSNLGHIRELSRKVDLCNMYPQSGLTSTNYCLANPGKEYIIYFPEGGKATVDLTHSNTSYQVTWFIPVLNQWVVGTNTIEGGEYKAIVPPFSGAVVLWLKSINRSYE